MRSLQTMFLPPQSSVFQRRYRLCFWDGQPTRVWSPVMEVVFGG